MTLQVSVLENHHCAMTFAVLRRKECALLVRGQGGDRGGQEGVCALLVRG